MKTYRETINEVARIMFNRWRGGADLVQPQYTTIIAFVYNKNLKDVTDAIQDAYETKRVMYRGGRR